MQEVDDPKQARELAHPTRLRIWWMYGQDRNRSLLPRDLQRGLSDMEEQPTISQVNYHLRRLQRVGLVPER